MAPIGVERFPHQLGYLVVNEDGAVVMSGGELENDEHVATVIFNLLNVASKRNLLPPGSSENFNRLSIHYDSHVYNVVHSNRKIHITKRKYVPAEPVIA